MLTLDRADKWREEFSGLDRTLSENITELLASLSSVRDDMKDLTIATARRIQQLSDVEAKERNTLEKILLRELYSMRDQFVLKWENIEKTITVSDNDTKQR